MRFNINPGGKEMKRMVLAGAALAIGLMTPMVQAGDNPFVEEVFVHPEKFSNDPPLSGKMVGDNCSACHGTQGRIFDEIIPPLAGMPKATFVELMMRFKADKRPAIVMNKVAREFTRSEIERMGDYFAGQPARPWLETSEKGE